VSDPAYARDRAASLRARGHGGLRIAADLAARGFDEAMIEAAVEESREGQPEIEWARKALARARGAEGARAWRLLASHGFAEEVIVDLLGEPEATS
jgi:SOS response regulatory protein OraA/RecX